MRGYHGFIGDGKTANMVRDVLRACNRRKKTLVVSNTPIDLKRPENFYLWNDTSELEAIASYFFAVGFSPRPIIVCIDEANLVMPSRFFKDLKSFMLPFLAESRKLNVEIWFTTQHPARPDVILRELTEEWIHCKCYSLPFPDFAYMREERKEEGKWHLSMKSIPILFTRKVQFLDKECNLLEEKRTWPSFGLRSVWGRYDTHYLIGMNNHKPDMTASTELLDWLSSSLHFAGGTPPQNVSERILAVSVPPPEVRASNSAPLGELQHIITNPVNLCQHKNPSPVNPSENEKFSFLVQTTTPSVSTVTATMSKPSSLDGLDRYFAMVGTQLIQTWSTIRSFLIRPLSLTFKKLK